MARVRLRYYALLREQAGLGEELVESAAADMAGLYAELAGRHGFRLAREQLRVAVNSEFSDWSRPLADGDEVVFIPPVAGG
jgi:molybdopterin converting factor subunit 1